MDLRLPAGRAAAAAAAVYPASPSAQRVVLSRGRRAASPPSDQLTHTQVGGAFVTPEEVGWLVGAS